MPDEAERRVVTERSIGILGDIERLLHRSDKGEFLDWVTSNIEGAEKGVVVFGIPDGRGGLDLIGRQFGFQYIYEVHGFLELADNIFASEDGGLDDVTEGG